MSQRVSIHLDDGTKIDFNDIGDALYHASVQGVAGVKGIETEGGESVLTRKQLDERVDEVRRGGSSDERLKAARRLAKE